MAIGTWSQLDESILCLETLELGEKVSGRTWELSSRDTWPWGLGKGGSWSAVEEGKDAFDYWLKLGEIKQWRERNRTR